MGGSCNSLTCRDTCQQEGPRIGWKDGALGLRREKRKQLVPGGFPLSPEGGWWIVSLSLSSQRGKEGAVGAGSSPSATLPLRRWSHNEGEVGQGPKEGSPGWAKAALDSGAGPPPAGHSWEWG